MRRFSVIAMLLLGFWVGGCESKPRLVAVTGKVMMQGKPLTAGNIFFHPDIANEYRKDKPSSQLRLDGSFTIKTFPFGEGVPPGRYRVTLSPDLASRIQRPVYADPSSSPWNLEVPPSGLKDQVFEIK